MKSKIITAIVCLSLLSLISACASNEAVIAPEIQTGDPLKHEYLVGKWCTNRELTSVANSDAGFSALLNVSKEFWKFTDDNKWQSAESGWIYKTLGKWQLEGRDTVRSVSQGRQGSVPDPVALRLTRQGSRQPGSKLERAPFNHLGPDLLQVLFQAFDNSV
jgi:hypothetical protein